MSEFPGQPTVEQFLGQYQTSFSAKVYNTENNDHDVLMDIFTVTPELKRQNRQYWGRELGMCWQLIISALFQATRKDFAPGFVAGADELCDLIAGDHAIDTKYRIGSGDSGTLKKFKQYGRLLREEGLKPILLIVREDNLGAAIKACQNGGWSVLTGKDSFNYVSDMTGVDFLHYLKSKKDAFSIDR